MFSEIWRGSVMWWIFLFYEHGSQCFVLWALTLNPVSFPEANMMDEWVDVKSPFPFFLQVLLLACAEDLECVPGFQQKVFYIEQPFEFTEDQPVLKRMLFSHITIVQKSELLMYSYYSCHLSENFFFLYRGFEILPWFCLGSPVLILYL